MSGNQQQSVGEPLPCYCDLGHLITSATILISFSLTLVGHHGSAVLRIAKINVVGLSAPRRGQVGTISVLGTGTNWLDTWLPLICQRSPAPWLFNHRRSVLPSAVKSATALKCHSNPSCAEGVNMREMAPPFMYQIWTSLLVLTQTTSGAPSFLKVPTAAHRHSDPICPTLTTVVASIAFNAQLCTFPEVSSHSSPSLPLPKKSPSVMMCHSAPIWAVEPTVDCRERSFKDQTLKLPAVFSHRTSVFWSPLKSPSEATCHSLPIWPSGMLNPVRRASLNCQIATCPPDPLVHTSPLLPLPPTEPLKLPAPNALHSGPIWAGVTISCVNVIAELRGRLPKCCQT